MIIGTAGHVDHGKTELSRALTGIDTDRFREEKERGISIDIGFAPIRFPGGGTAGLIDVPGHEKFIHNMLAGVGGIDLVLMVIDATEGVMPQTREHLDILSLLQIKKGIAVITKKDLVDGEWLDLLTEEVGEYLKGTFLAEAQIHLVSALTGEGIPELKTAIEEMSDTFPLRDKDAPLRIPLDRSFIISGFGTVVTGTLLSGTVKTGQVVEILPPGEEYRVRGIQVYGESVEEAFAGQRVAVNLAGLEKREVQRGSVAATPGFFHLTRYLDVRIKLLPSAAKPLSNLAPVHFYLGTSRLVAKILLLGREELAPGEEGLAQCRLDRPIVASRGDLFIIRSYSPMVTIGGGAVLDEDPPRHKRFKKEVLEKLQELSIEDLLPFIMQKIKGAGGAALQDLAHLTRLGADPLRLELDRALQEGKIVLLGDLYITSGILDAWFGAVLEGINQYHTENPLSPGPSKAHAGGSLPRQAAGRAYDALLTLLKDKELIRINGERVALHSFTPSPSKVQEAHIERIREIFHKDEVSPVTLREITELLQLPADEAENLLDYLAYLGETVKTGESIYFDAAAYQRCLESLKEYFHTQKTITLAKYRDLIKSSRKSAQTLLEHFDSCKYTRRVGDARVPWKL